MFESVTFRRGEANFVKTLDLGLLAEALLFYKTTNLILDDWTLKQLSQTVGTATTQRLIESPNVQAHIENELLCVMEPNPEFLGYEFQNLRMTTTPQGVKLRSKEDHIKWFFNRAIGFSDEANRQALKMSKFVKMKSTELIKLRQSTLPEQSMIDLTNSDYIHAAISAALKEMVPCAQNGADWYFKTHPLRDGFLIDTNLDFSKINEEYERTQGVEKGTLGPGHFANEILEANAGLAYAASHNSDLIVKSSTSAIMQLKLQKLVDSRSKNKTQIEVFQSATIGRGAALREAINSGQRSFEEFLDLMEHAKEFKHWISNQEPSESLVRDYYSEITAGTWADKLPSKVLRFALFTGAGFLTDLLMPTGIGTLTGLGLGAGDAFLVDKLAKGWKPNTFIDGPFREFHT